MIEFKGDLSAQTKKDVHKIKTKKTAIRVVFFLLLMIIPIYSLFNIPHVFYLEVAHYSAILIGIVMIAGIFKNFREGKEPSQITIEEDKIIAQNETFKTLRKVSDVKKVVDFGEWYHILFDYQNESFSFVCQKDLLTKGSLEEFEACFEGKLEKKFKK